MSRLTDPAGTLRPAGPLTLDGFVSAIWHGSTALRLDPSIPGVSREVAVTTMWRAAMLAVDPYCAGDRDGAVAAIADVLSLGWRDWPTELGQVAAKEAEALLVWLEQRDPSMN